MRRVIPGVLWISLIALGLFSLIQLLIGIMQPNVAMLISVVFNVLVLVGLYHGHRWAFVVTLVLGLLGIVVTLALNPAMGLGVLIGNGLVLVPMLLAKDYFWAARGAAGRFAPNYCHHCGQMLSGVVGAQCPRCGIEIRRVDRGEAI
jgi:hypothetical protein